MKIKLIAEPESPNVDLVAVHGLCESSSETWMNPQKHKAWLRDPVLFPYHTLRTRVLSFEYDPSRFTIPGRGGTISNGILDLATNLIAELDSYRQANDGAEHGHRPIIFICHGFGGLLVKRALALSWSKTKSGVSHLRAIYISTHGILFMGTPHNGLDETLILNSGIDKYPGPSQFMLNLLTGSDTIKEITDLFAPLAKRFAIYNFWEGLEAFFDDQAQQPVYIVDALSAAPVWEQVDKCGIMANHSGMVKFSTKSDPGYIVVYQALEKYIKAAPRVVSRRWEQEMERVIAERKQEADDLLQEIPSPPSQIQAIEPYINVHYMVHRCSSSYFVGRTGQADKVKEMFGDITTNPRSKHKILVIHGLGGSGKTQFSLRYIENNRHRYWGIFGLTCSNELAAEKGFASLGENAQKASSLEAGMHWLSNQSTSWLLVLDNADDPEMDLSRFFPAGGNGHILVTTRNPGVRIHNTVGYLKFQGMDPEEAITLLLKLAYPEKEPKFPLAPQNRQMAEGIASELGYLALALTHAGATIRQNIFTLERYLKYYLGHRRNMIRSRSVNSCTDANIISTWEIPFERIASKNSLAHKDAVELIQLFAFMHFDSIPEQLLQRSSDSIRKLKSSLAIYPAILKVKSMWNEDSQIRFRLAMNVLYDHSIIDNDHEKKVCSLHPVVHRWARDRLNDTQQKDWLGCASSILAHSISSNFEMSERKFRKQLLPHISSCISALKDMYGSLPNNIEQAAELEKFALVYAENGQWKHAKPLQEKVVRFRVKVLGNQHHSTLQGQRNLASMHWDLFEVQQALRLQSQILRAQWRSRPSIFSWIKCPLNPIHTSYCVALDEFTRTLWLSGQREKSRQTGQRAVYGLTKVLGHDDPQSLNAMFNLARTYLHLGEFEKSQELLAQVVQKREHWFGKEHPDTLMARNEKAMISVILKQDLLTAESEISDVLKARKETLGEEHAYTLWSVNDLSKVYCATGRWGEAVKNLQDILPVVARTLGETHVGMIMTKSNLARAYIGCNRWTDARNIIQPLLSEVPSQHPDWFHINQEYISILLRLDDMDGAERSCNAVLDNLVRYSTFGLAHPYTLSIAKQLEKIYKTQWRYEDCDKLIQRFPSLKRSSHPNKNLPSNPDLLPGTKTISTPTNRKIYHSKTF
ncbi:uncharacterized protein EAF02_009583 [Botrytis sinoallii]|uniref:uncharacterized protein n=1 Tax=Botrytis sinoallii TaxID=1463999 RepID=UPI001901FFC9|nr:uncharacterized protein EAF02_009583 [Botrytis sinoallii]KAF7868847.1 hypothetical protein EAF02_009583 [Botrytis sinoallii]